MGKEGGCFASPIPTTTIQFSFSDPKQTKNASMYSGGPLSLICAVWTKKKGSWVWTKRIQIAVYLVLASNVDAMLSTRYYHMWSLWSISSTPETGKCPVYTFKHSYCCWSCQFGGFILERWPAIAGSLLQLSRAEHKSSQFSFAKCYLLMTSQRSSVG